MTLPRPLTTVFLLCSAAALSGCVAAAIPLVAGGALARTSTDGEPGPSVEKAPTAKPAGQQSQLAATSSVPPSSESASEALQEALVAPPSERERTSALAQKPELAEFVRYSTEKAYAFTQGGEALATAVLVNPASLDGERRMCEQGDERDPAILIDLDPGDGVFGEASPLPTEKSIALSIKVLRSEGVTVAWISENSAANADIVRDALTTSGLDPEAEDTLLLMRYPGDRKQTRREEFASETCLIAIAGDERRDFDELYEYLTNRNAALALEPMFNNGWFLVGEQKAAAPVAPNAIVAENPQSEFTQAFVLEPEVQGPPATDEKQDQ